MVGVAGACTGLQDPLIPKTICFLRLAQCCTGSRPRWCQVAEVLTHLSEARILADGDVAPKQDRRGRSEGTQDPPERREVATRGPLARSRPRIPEPRRQAARPQQPPLPRVLAAARGGRARRRGFHVPQPATHLRDRTVQPAQAPEDHPFVARALFQHADNGHLFAPARRR